MKKQDIWKYAKIGGYLQFRGTPIITPIISALFASYYLEDEDEVGRIQKTLIEGQRALFVDCCDHVLTWAGVAIAIWERVEDLGLNAPTEEFEGFDDLSYWIPLLNTKFRIDSDKLTPDMLPSKEAVKADDPIDVEVLFKMAQLFNDGHNLTGVVLHASDNGMQVGDHIGISRQELVTKDYHAVSDSQINLGQAKSIASHAESKNHGPMSWLIYSSVSEQLRGITDPELRESVRQGLIDMLKQNA